jgi:hypothetical protein
MSNSYLLVAGKVGSEFGQTSKSWSLGAPVPLSLPKVSGSWNAKVEATDSLAKADGQLESCMRRVERSVSEADSEIQFRPNSQQVCADCKGFPDNLPSPGGFFFKVGTHGGKNGTNSLYRNKEGVWLYFEQDGWYVDAGKFPGDGKKSDSWFFKSHGGSSATEDAPSGRYDPNASLVVGSATFTAKMEPLTSPELCFTGEDREFKVKAGENWVNLDEALAKKSWCNGQTVCWDEFKFSTRLPVQDLLAEMQKQAAEYDETFKAVNQKYNEDKNKKIALVVKDTLSHVTRDLLDIITPSTATCSTPPKETDDFIETNNLTTFICCVPKGGDQEFLQWYESAGAGTEKARREADEAKGKGVEAAADGELNRMKKVVVNLSQVASEVDPVIPRSAKKLSVPADKDGVSLWRVVVYHKDFNKADKDGNYEARKDGPATAFTKACRESKYIVRDYKFSQEIYAKASAERELCLGNFMISHVQLCEIGVQSFAALFDIWMHMKVLRLTIEATLRYQSVDNSSAYLLCPNPSKIVELRKALALQLANKQDLKMLDVTDDDSVDNFPYVSLSLNPLSSA